jgi:hypothetical protein
MDPDVGIDESRRHSKGTTMVRTATKAKDRLDSMDSMERLRSAGSDNLKLVAILWLCLGKHEKMREQLHVFLKCVDGYCRTASG